MLPKIKTNVPFIERPASNLREAAIRNLPRTNFNEQLCETQLWTVKTQKDTSNQTRITEISFSQRVGRNCYSVQKIPLYDNSSPYKVLQTDILKRNAMGSSSVCPHGVMKKDVIKDDVDGDAAGKYAVAKGSSEKRRLRKHPRIALLPTIYESAKQNTTTYPRANGHLVYSDR